jgi:hypothetical protein
VIVIITDLELLTDLHVIMSRFITAAVRTLNSLYIILNDMMDELESIWKEAAMA